VGEQYGSQSSLFFLVFSFSSFFFRSVSSSYFSSLFFFVFVVVLSVFFVIFFIVSSIFPNFTFVLFFYPFFSSFAYLSSSPTCTIERPTFTQERTTGAARLVPCDNCSKNRFAISPSANRPRLVYSPSRKKTRGNDAIMGK
jgi:hypothetical protein